MLALAMFVHAADETLVNIVLDSLFSTICRSVADIIVKPIEKNLQQFRIALQVNQMRQFFLSNPPKSSQFVYDPEVKEKLDTIATLAYNREAKNVLLSGTPGTGKTAYMRMLGAALVKKLEEVYTIFLPGSFFKQFKNAEAASFIQMLFEDIQNRVDRGEFVVLFCDEVDGLLGANTSKNMKSDLVSLFVPLLSNVNARKQNSKGDFMFVFSTNDPHLVESSISSKIDYFIEIAESTNSQRKKTINLYLQLMNKTYSKLYPNRKICDISNNTLDYIAKQNLAPAEIELVISNAFAFMHSKNFKWPVGNITLLYYFLNEKQKRFRLVDRLTTLELNKAMEEYEILFKKYKTLYSYECTNECHFLKPLSLQESTEIANK